MSFAAELPSTFMSPVALISTVVFALICEIARVFPDVQVAGHSDAVLEAVKQAAGA